jgi:hypothetical protein
MQLLLLIGSLTFGGMFLYGRYGTGLQESDYWILATFAAGAIVGAVAAKG